MKTKGSFSLVSCKKMKHRKSDKKKELRQLNRKELLELLVKQSERIDALEQELEQERKMQAERDTTFAVTSNFAEALMKLNGVFDAAEAAANEYIEQLEKKKKHELTYQNIIEEETRKRAVRLLLEETSEQQEKQVGSARVVFRAQDSRAPQAGLNTSKREPEKDEITTFNGSDPAQMLEAK